MAAPLDHSAARGDRNALRQSLQYLLGSGRAQTEVLEWCCYLISGSN